MGLRYWGGFLGFQSSACRKNGRKAEYGGEAEGCEEAEGREESAGGTWRHDPVHPDESDFGLSGEW